MIRAVIIEDQISCTEELTSLLSQHKERISIEGTAGSVKSGLLLFKEIRPDVIFLDVELPDGSAFDLLEQLSDFWFQVVFVTAYEVYAIRAFKANAIDFLLKPIEPDELNNVVDKLCVWDRNFKNNEDIKNLQTRAYRNAGKIRLNGAHPDQIIVGSREGLSVVPANNIEQITADNTYSELSLINGKKIVVSKSIGDFEDILDPEKFCRVHKSHIIALKHLKKYDRKEQQVTLLSGSILPVARRRASELSRRLMVWSGR